MKKELGTLTSLTFVIGTVIGAGVFFKPQAVYSATGSGSLGILTWLVGGIIAICSGLTAAELSSSIPETGGMIIYLKRAYGNLIGFLAGWVQSAIYIPAIIAALSIIFAEQFATLFGIGDWISVSIISIITLATITLINFISAKVSGSMQLFLTVCKILPIILITILGLFYTPQNVQTTTTLIKNDSSLLTSFGSGLIACMFAYDGWIYVGSIAGEMKNPQKDLPRAIILGLSIITLVYVLINIAYLNVMPAHSLAATPTPGSDVASILMGGFGGRLITIGILISVFGTLNGFMTFSMRIPYAMSIENTLPFSNWLSRLSNNRVPTNCGIVVFVISTIMIFSGTFNVLTDMCTALIFIFYILVFMAVFLLRKRNPNMVRPYKVPLYPIIPIIAIIGGSYIVIDAFIHQPGPMLIAILLTLIGVPIYFYRRSTVR